MTFSVPEIGLFLQSDGSGLELGVLASLPLGHIVLQRTHGRAAQNNDHRQVDQRHNAHQHIGQIPNKAHAHAGAEPDDTGGNQTEAGHKGFGRNLVHNVGEQVVNIVEVAQQGGKGEQCRQQNYRPESNADKNRQAAF